MRRNAVPPLLDALLDHIKLSRIVVHFAPDRSPTTIANVDHPLILVGCGSGHQDASKPEGTDHPSKTYELSEQATCRIRPLGPRARWLRLAGRHHFRRPPFAILHNPASVYAACQSCAAAPPALCPFNCGNNGRHAFVRIALRNPEMKRRPGICPGPPIFLG